MIKHFIKIEDIDFRSEVKRVDSSPRHYPRNILLPGLYKKIALLFYEPSTRTSSSFWAAAQDLNFSVLPINQVQYSSVAKGETLEDTIRTIGSYVDGIVLRHPEKGAAAAAAEVSPVPIINAGDGDGDPRCGRPYKVGGVLALLAVPLCRDHDRTGGGCYLRPRASRL